MRSVLKSSRKLLILCFIQYGVFPLKGKMLNVRDAGYKQITENQEIQNLIKVLGL